MNYQRDRIVRIREAQNITGLSRTAIHRLRTEGLFVEPIALGDRSIGYSEEELYAWVDRRKAERQRSAAARAAA